jgi:hypothetical protein
LKFVSTILTPRARFRWAGPISLPASQAKLVLSVRPVPMTVEIVDPVLSVPTVDPAQSVETGLSVDHVQNAHHVPKPHLRAEPTWWALKIPSTLKLLPSLAI